MTDYLLSDGSLSRVLTLGTGGTYKFPDDSLVVITRDGREVYDWYGRRVQLGEGIDSVVRHYGSFSNGPDPTDANETFVVRKKNGKLAIASLSFAKQEPERTNQCPYFKQIFLGSQLYRTPKISPNNKWGFDGIRHDIIETPVMQAFLSRRAGAKNPEKQWDQFVGVQEDGSDEPPFTIIRPNTLFGLDMMISTWLSYRFGNRDALLNTPKGKEPPYSQENNWLLSDVTIAENGHKLLATTGQGRPIATDTEVIEHIMACPSPPLDLYWYYTD